MRWRRSTSGSTRTAAFTTARNRTAAKAVYGSTPLELHMSIVQNGPFNEIVQKRVYAEILGA